jgi:DNA-binding CsgD family transcriptional regulator
VRARARSLVSSGLLERELELARVSELLGAAGAGRGGLLLIAGPAGIGKTSLLDACAQSADERGMVVLRVRGDELVMESSFAAVRELLWDEVRSAGRGVWDGAARLAAPVFEDEGGRGADRDLAAAVLHGLYWLVAGLAERGPLVLLVDDAHWLDAASARFLVYLARRIDSLAVLLVIATRRAGVPDAGSQLGALVESAASVLPVRPLSEAASGALVRERLGARADDELCRSCHEATGGNPFYLRELTTALAAERCRPTVEAAKRIRELGAGTIGRTVLVRLARLGAECERLAQAVAVLGPGCSLRHAAVLGTLERDRAEAAADALRAADLLAAGRALSFVHPIVSEALTAELAPSRRAALHARAANVLAGDGARADRVAAHLLSAEPYGEMWVVDALRAAAREALARGAPEVAGSYLRRALAEPPAPDARLEVLIELGRAEKLLPAAHDFTALREALALARDPHQRAEIALELSLALFGVIQSREGRVVLEEALEDEESLSPEMVEVLEAALIGGGLDDLSATRVLLARAGRHFERAMRGEVRDPRMLAVLAIFGALTGMPARESASLARLALRDQRLLSQWLDDGYVTATWALCAAGGLADAARAQDAGIVEAQRRGSAPMFMQLAVMRAETALRTGDLDLAEVYAQRAVELGRELGAEHAALTWLPVVLLERGQVHAAARLVDSVEFSDSMLEGSVGVVVLAHRGRARVAAGELDRGLADLLEADRRMAAAGFQLSVITDWASTAALALARLGRHEEARQLAAREVADAVAFGAPPRHGVALSLSGLLEPGDPGLVRLHEAVGILQRTPARLEHARALVNLGEGLRARGHRHESRKALSLGLDLAHRAGAAALAQRARAELVATGARPRREALSGPDALTPGELRTARMAAEGLSNREIAQALFVSAKTVEAQLSQAYAKLSIQGRRELATALRGTDLARMG